MAVTTEFAELIEMLKTSGYDVYQINEPYTWHVVKDGVIVTALREPRNLWFER